MLDNEPVGFEVNRDDTGGEKVRVLYSRQNDKYFQLQESLNECSTFIQDQILKGKYPQSLYKQISDDLLVASDHGNIYQSQ